MNYYEVNLFEAGLMINLLVSVPSETDKLKRSRLGVYGLLEQYKKILVVTQMKGIYKGRYDFPGGGVEFGESAEEALRREFQEETSLDFEVMELFANLTALVDSSGDEDKGPFIFHQIGMIYKIRGIKRHVNTSSCELPYGWIDIEAFTENNTTPLLWKALNLI